MYIFNNNLKNTYVLTKQLKKENIADNLELLSWLTHPSANLHCRGNY